MSELFNRRKGRKGPSENVWGGGGGGGVGAVQKIFVQGKIKRQKNMHAKKA